MDEEERKRVKDALEGIALKQLDKLYEHIVNLRFDEAEAQVVSFAIDEARLLRREHVMPRQTLHTSLIGRQVRFHKPLTIHSLYPDEDTVCTIVNVYLDEGVPCVDVEDPGGSLHRVHCSNIASNALCSLLPRSSQDTGDPPIGDLGSMQR